MTVLSITGHRLGPRLGGYSPNPIDRAVQREILEKIVELKPTTLISGMAFGVDQWAAQPRKARCEHCGQVLR